MRVCMHAAGTNWAIVGVAGVDWAGGEGGDDCGAVKGAEESDATAAQHSKPGGDRTRAAQQ